MGFFSWNCNGCGVSLRSRHATDNEDHINSVILSPQGFVLIGEYDGYGRVNDINISEGCIEPECWHKKCWEAAGEPKYFSKSSECADDQGYFFGDDREEDINDFHCGW